MTAVAGLLAFLALRVPNGQALGLAALFMLGGLLLALAVAAVPKLRQGYQVRGRLMPFLVFLLLESPRLVYTGVLLGTALGAFSVTDEATRSELLVAVGGGVALGVVFGGSGNGEQIAANKVKGIRAALVWNLSTAVLARDHNDANVISIGARQHPVEDVIAFIDTFIAEPFTAEERHVRRIAQLAEFEQTGTIRGKGVDALPGRD